MSTSRDRILDKLRAARRPFDDAPPRPKIYLPVTVLEDSSPDALLTRFEQELTRLAGKLFTASGDDVARDLVLERLKAHGAEQIIAWDFAHIPVDGLEAAIRDAGIGIIEPRTHGDDRARVLARSAGAQVGLTGADAAAATTGTLIFSTAPGKGRIPTVLAPVHIAVITFDQIVPRIESWIAAQRQNGLQAFRAGANFCFITGPSRTGDIEMELILGVHGPGQVEVIVKR